MNDPNNEDLLAAVNAAIDGDETPEGVETEEEEEGEAPNAEDTDTNEEEASGEDAEGEETDGEDAEGEETDEEEADGEEKPEQTEEEKAAAAALAEDPLDAPIPKTLSERTQERMRSVIGMVKEFQPKAQQYDELIGYISGTGASADEFSMQLTYAKLLHSDNIEDNRQAYAILVSEQKSLAERLGITLPGQSPLEGHADLQDLVKAGKTTPEIAAEVAANRNAVKAADAHRTAAQQRAQQAVGNTEAAKTADLASRAALNDLGAHLEATDPKFKAKIALMPKETMAKIWQTPANLRVNAFLTAFRAIKLPAKAAAVVAGKPNVKKAVNQPLRANRQPAGGTKGAPKSALEAMNVAIDGAG